MFNNKLINCEQVGNVDMPKTTLSSNPLVDSGLEQVSQSYLHCPHSVIC